MLAQEPPPALLKQAPELEALPAAALQALMLVNPLMLVTISALVGAGVAHLVQLRSRLAGDKDARLAPAASAFVGLCVAAVLFSTDAVLAGSLGEAWLRFVAEANAAPQLPALATGLLYGGLAEEVMLRWGVMSLVAWLIWAVQRRLAPARLQPSSAVMWTAIACSALVFALGHLPALGQSVALTGPLIARTLLLNALAGLAYGWLFWRNSLESAMLAHAATHAGLALARALQ